MRSALPVPDAVALLAGTSASQLLMVSESGTFYRSVDAGVSWTATSVVPASDVVTLVPLVNGLLLLTRTGTVYSSTDGGVTFTPVGVITASDIVSATRVLNSIYALTATGSVYRSRDNGATWSGVGVVTTSDAVDIGALGARLYVVTASGDVARSTDGGLSWTFITMLPQSGITSFIVAGSILMVGTDAGDVATSTNGTTWTWPGTLNQVTLRALATDNATASEIPAVAAPGVRFLGARPNPASGTLQLAFDLDSASPVTVRVLDAAGREVARPIAGEVLADGATLRDWRPGALAAGTYYLRASIGGRDEVRKLVYLGAP